MLSWLFGPKESVIQRVRRDKLAIATALKTLDQHIYIAERDQNKCVEDIKKAAASHNKRKIQFACKRYIFKSKEVNMIQQRQLSFEKARAQLTQIEANALLMQSMQKTSSTLSTVSGTGMNMTELNKIMTDYQKQSEQLNMFTERMDEAMDFAADDGEFEDDGDELIRMVMDQLHLQELEGFVTAPKGGLTPPVNDAKALDEAVKRAVA